MLKSIIRVIIIPLLLGYSCQVCSQNKYDYIDKYKYIPSDFVFLLTGGYTYNSFNNSNEFNVGVGKGHIKYWNINCLNLSYSKQNLGIGPSTLLSMYSGPLGVSKSIYTREKLNIYGNINIVARILLIDSEELLGLVFIPHGEASLTFETSNLSFDIGYTISQKNISVNFEDNSSNTFNAKVLNPYYGFFIRFNISSILDIGSSVNNSRLYVGKEKVRLPNPKLDIKYSFSNTPIEAGQSESILINAINNGKGNAENVWLKINSNDPDVISFQNSHYIGNLLSKSSKDLTIPVTISKNLYNKKNIKINFSVEEKDGFKSNATINLVAIPQKPIFPPELKIPKSSVQFVDKNNILEAGERAFIKFNLINVGKGTAIGLKLKINPQNYEGINFEKESVIGNLEPNRELELSIPLETNFNTKNGICKLSFIIEESNGFNTEPIQLEIPTSQFLPPNVLVTDYLVSTTNNQQPKLGEPINIKFSIQNIGQSSAKDVSIGTHVPSNVFFSTNNSFEISELKPNESKIFEIELFANKLYSKNDIPITIDIKESFGKYSQNKTAVVELNTNQSITSIVIDGKTTSHDIKILGLRSDVDINIPEKAINKPNTYALIIGNEDYSSRQNSSNKEIDVIYAKNDALIFRTYLMKVFGVPEENINLLINATASEIRQGLDKLRKIASLVGSRSNFIMFYAGHGISDNIAKEPYLIPVDVNASNLEYAIKLREFTNIFETNAVNRSTLFLDACFSGFGRNQSLIETRGVRVKPKFWALPKNTIIFSSSSEIEPSYPFDSQKHGLFTYYLLKKIQESNGDVNLNDLFEYLKENVSIQSVLLKNQQQTPSIILGNDSDINWKNLKLVE